MVINLFNFIQSYLLFCRKRYNNNKVVTLAINISLIIGLFVGMYFIDKNIYIDTKMNYVRTILIAVTAILIFTLESLLSNQIKIKKTEKDKDYMSYKESLSHNQRINLSIIVIVLIIAIHIIFFRSTSNVYSIFSSIILSIILIMVNFTSMTGYERYLEENDFMDIRDVEHAERLMEDNKEVEEDS